MTRNLDRRIELMFPVEQPELSEQLKKILFFHINDCDKARELQSSGEYTSFIPLEQYSASRSQKAIADWFRSRTAAALDGSAGTPLKIRKIQGKKHG